MYSMSAVVGSRDFEIKLSGFIKKCHSVSELDQQAVTDDC